MDNNFRFFLPVTIEKGGTDDDEQMLIRGVASTGDEDHQGEYLDPSGFDVSYLLSSGVFNLNHAKEGLASAIGEPTSAKLTKRGLELEGFLYKDNPIAKQTHQLAKILAKGSKTRRMGFSIEGTCIERDPLNPKRIKKAKISGCALTLNPINANTFVEVVKGIDNGLKWEYNFIEKDGEKFLLNTIQGDQIVTVDTDYNIHIEKALTAGAISGTDTIDSTTASGAGLKTESVEGDTTSTEDSDEEKEKILKKKKYLKKSEVFEILFTDIYTTDLRVVKQLYNLIDKISKSMNQKEISQEAISKAYEVLGLEKSPIVKGMDFEAVKSICKSMIKDGASKEDCIKSLKDQDVSEDDIEKAFINFSEEKKSDAKEDKAKDEDEDEFDEEDEDVKKVKADKMVKKAISKGYDRTATESLLIEKGFSAEIRIEALSQIKDKEDILLEKAMSSVEKLITSSQEKTSEEFRSVGELVKSMMSEIETLKEQNLTLKEEFEQKLDELSTVPASQPKSLITKGFQERFTPIAESRSDLKVINISDKIQKGHLLNYFDSKIDWNQGLTAETTFYAEAASMLEGTNSLPPNVISALATRDKIQVVIQ